MLVGFSSHLAIGFIIDQTFGKKKASGRPQKGVKGLQDIVGRASKGPQEASTAASQAASVK
jgi:hypothetical protein